jgi:hypothetical protein
MTNHHLTQELGVKDTAENFKKLQKLQELTKV